jgi:hypothetical protein
MMAVPSPRQLTVSLSPRRPKFNLRPVSPRFVMDKIAMRQVFLPVPGFSAVGIIPTKYHTHLHIHAGLTGKTNGLSFETFQKKKLSSFERVVTGYNHIFTETLIELLPVRETKQQSDLMAMLHNF